MTPQKKLDKISGIIEHVDDRCLLVDGPVSQTLQEMTQEEISEIYELSSGKKNLGRNENVIYTDNGSLVVYVSEDKKGKPQFISFDEDEAIKKGVPVRVRYLKDD